MKQNSYLRLVRRLRISGAMHSPPTCHQSEHETTLALVLIVCQIDGGMPTKRMFHIVGGKHL